MSRRAPLIAGIVAVLLALVAIVFLVLPKRGDVRDAEDELQVVEAEQFSLESQLADLERAAEDSAGLRRELARFRRAVPPVADLPGLINLLQTAADISGVEFMTIAPTTPVVAPQGQATEIPAQVQVIGGFFAVNEFIFRLETLPRASKVVTIQVAAGPDQLPQLDISMDVRFYTTDLQAGPGATPPEAAGTEPGGATPTPTSSPTTSPEPVT